MSENEAFALPASFEFLVHQLRMQAQVQLGVLHLGAEDERPEPQLPLARHAIDLLAMLVEKTKGNLSWEEQRLVENSLTELRFQYIQAMESAGKRAAAAAAGSTSAFETRAEEPEEADDSAQGGD
ncbi:MAG: DUF1844 domain-containing protein [Bryobacteraceae bacterium]